VRARIDRRRVRSPRATVPGRLCEDRMSARREISSLTDFPHPILFADFARPATARLREDVLRQTAAVEAVRNTVAAVAVGHAARAIAVSRPARSRPVPRRASGYGARRSGREGGGSASFRARQVSGDGAPPRRARRPVSGTDVCTAPVEKPRPPHGARHAAARASAPIARRVEPSGRQSM